MLRNWNDMNDSKIIFQLIFMSTPFIFDLTMKNLFSERLKPSETHESLRN